MSDAMLSPRHQLLRAIVFAWDSGDDEEIADAVVKFVSAWIASAHELRDDRVVRDVLRRWNQEMSR
jgi:hypothetical protein